MKKNLLKLLSILFIIIFIPPTIYADDANFEENINYSEIIQSVEASSDIDSTPQINARHAIVFDRASKTALYKKNETDQCKMASTTKIMTAIIVIENTNLNDIVKISSKAAGTGGSRLGLSTNDSISVENLLYGLLMKSGNDAAVALAEYVGGGELTTFSSMMNEKATELNLQSTNFVTPHGLDNENHYTTALDLALLTDYALNNEIFSNIVKTKTYTIMINNNPKTLNNTNELLGNFDGIYGVKTGFTNGANRCLVTSCKRGDLDVICVVLGCDTKKDRTRDSIKLLNYTFNNFSVVNVKDILFNNFNEWKLSHKYSFLINKGISQSFDLYLNSDDIKFSHIAVKNSDIDKIVAEISIISYFEAPVKSNTKIGEIILKINNINYFSVRILNRNSINKKNVIDYLYHILKNYTKVFINS